MRDSWDRRIARAKHLAAGDPAIRSLLDFYANLLTLQKELQDMLRARHSAAASVTFESHLTLIRTAAPNLLRMVARIGPEPLADEAVRILSSDDAALDDLLRLYWRSPSDRQFFAKALLQPYAEWARESTVTLRRELPRENNRCPFCGGAPQLSVLDRGGDAEGGGRSLLCATCLHVWPFRRVRCANCGEEDEQRLGYFHSSAFDHLRLDACETCRRYLKTVDLTRLGIAVPLVDEVAGAPLDLWARDAGYAKLELNLLGL
jgi:FdhE protein